MKKLSSKAKAKFGVISGAVLAMATSASAAIDLTAVDTAFATGKTDVESVVPSVLGFVIVLVVIGAIIGTVKRAR